jgi:hypothetical protein
MLKNPFLEFHPRRYSQNKLQAKRIVKANDGIVDMMLAGYLTMLETEMDNLAWLIEHDRIIKIYEAIACRISAMRIHSDDIEAFCTRLDGTEGICLMIPGPLGLYLSALINHSQEKQVKVKLNDYQRIFHFLGYRLPEKKTLLLDGDTGDFTGSGLCGGLLIVNGTVGNWCGAGMLSGEIRVRQNAGQHTGAWMHGGTIRVDGRIESTGDKRLGGEILMQKKDEIDWHGLTTGDAGHEDKEASGPPMLERSSLLQPL